MLRARDARRLRVLTPSTLHGRLALRQALEQYAQLARYCSLPGASIDDDHECVKALITAIETLMVRCAHAPCTHNGTSLIVLHGVWALSPARGRGSAHGMTVS